MKTWASGIPGAEDRPCDQGIICKDSGNDWAISDRGYAHPDME